MYKWEGVQNMAIFCLDILCVSARIDVTQSTREMLPKDAPDITRMTAAMANTQLVHSRVGIADVMLGENYVHFLLQTSSLLQGDTSCW